MEPWEESGEKHCFCRGCSRCRMNLSGRYTPKIKGNGVSSPLPQKKKSPAARLKMALF